MSATTIILVTTDGRRSVTERDAVETHLRGQYPKREKEVRQILASLDELAALDLIPMLLETQPGHYATDVFAPQSSC